MRQTLHSLLLILALSCCGIHAWAQTGENRVAVGVGASLTTLFSDFSETPFGLGGQLSLRWNIQPAFSLHGVAGVSGVTQSLTNQDLANFPNYFGATGGGIGTGFYPNTTPPLPREGTNNLSLNHFALLGSYNFQPGQRFVPFVAAGLGIVSFNPTTDASGVKLPNNLNNGYNLTALQLPLSVGAEYYLDDKLVLNGRATLGLVFSDYLDDLAEGGNDPLASLSIGISYYVFGELDCDKDGLIDREEERIGSDKCNPDTDGDNLPDPDEVRRHGTDPTNPDTDGDGLRSDTELLAHRTNPNRADTDGDRLSDGDEVSRKTDPLVVDTDGDDLNDGEEVLETNTNPLNPDSDADNLEDGKELHTYKTDPLNPDTDGDRLNDGEEVTTYRTDPLLTDSDSDEITDGEEVQQRKTDPRKKDTDGDQLSDGEEILRAGTNPLNPDTDADTVGDGDDECPLVPGVRERRGCPAPPKVGAVTSFPSIYFLVDSDQFDFGRTETTENLAKVLAYVNQCPGLTIIIEGHASREGSEQRNQELSDKRALRVKEWLVGQGVDSNKIDLTLGYGSRQNAVPEPIPNSPEAKAMEPTALESIRRQNRRIAIKVARTCD
ncbi:MAG: OmpA family protein [Chlorobi bacterium]|nr:OmpA family protein [Chlorobiota bacterium]